MNSDQLDWAINLDLYSHVLPGLQAAAADRLAAALGGALTTAPNS